MDNQTVSQLNNNTPSLFTTKKIKVLIEIRTAMDGFSGIPQEVRLLFRGLCTIPDLDVEGMIQSTGRKLSKGLPLKISPKSKFSTPSERYNILSKTIISFSEEPYKVWFQKYYNYVNKYLLRSFIKLFVRFTTIKLTRFEPMAFEDFIWSNFFARTLPASDFDIVTQAKYRICSVPIEIFRDVGIHLTNYNNIPLFPKIETEDIDIFIGQTPFPGKISKNTRMVIRYHDALPIFMPHTFNGKTRHQTMHFRALLHNVHHGAWFACVSETTRQDLLRLFPQAADRAVTIHNMVSHHYFHENSSPDRVPEIIRSRIYETSGLLPKFHTIQENEHFYGQSQKNIKYLLMVSTIEPRKNHTRLLSAWEVIKAEIDPDLKLVIVGTLGWEYKAITAAFKPWIDRGALLMLNAVPAPDLRVLYKHAAVTVCPSLGEGFDYSGAEAMSSGGPVIASDIPVHREVYDDAAIYFNPYATTDLVRAIKQVLYETNAAEQKAKLIEAGFKVAARYTPEAILPQWSAFLHNVAALPPR